MKPGPAKDYLNMCEVQENGCWEYTGAVHDNGYGSIRNTPAHRYFYQELVGEIAEGLHIDHLCHNPNECRRGAGCPHRRCVNPDHLEAVTPRENLMRSGSFAAINAHSTHCPEGHPYSGDNLIVLPTQRSCRACRVRRWEAARDRRKKQELTKSNLSHSHELILQILQSGPRTDAEVASAFFATRGKSITRQSVSQYRAELARVGFVKHVGERAVIPGTRPALLWAISEQAEKEGASQ